VSLQLSRIGLIRPMRPAANCGTPASPGCAKPGMALESIQATTARSRTTNATTKSWSGPLSAAAEMVLRAMLCPGKSYVHRPAPPRCLQGTYRHVTDHPAGKHSCRKTRSCISLTADLGLI